jgi:methylenetetrahydrofolate reductase (NADPH)
LGARNVLCLSGDPLHLGDHPQAAPVTDVGVLDLIGAVRRLRDEGVTMGGSEVADPPRYLIGAADVPLADPYDPARLEVKLDAGADVVWTQIAYDVEALSSWLDAIRGQGFLERAKVLVGIVPLRSLRAARFMDEKLPGVRVPTPIVEALEGAHGDAEAVGLELTVEIVKAIASLEGVGGIHLIGMGRDDLVRAVVERGGLFPRPTSWL